VEDRRRATRKTHHAVIIVDELYNQEEVIKKNQEIPIEIIDISKGGIGFNAKEEMPLDYYFNARIDLGKSNQFYSVIRIVRKDSLENDEGFRYGCEFIGLSDILMYYFDEEKPEIKTQEE